LTYTCNYAKVILCDKYKEVNKLETEKKKRKNDPIKAAEAVKRFRGKKLTDSGEPNLSGSKITIDYCSDDLKKEWKDYVAQSGLSFAKALEELLTLAKTRTITRQEEYKI
jgi:hypothetical protein